MFESQGGRCLGCETDVPGGGKGRFVVDHNHLTGVIRGLLCHMCNVALGMVKDKPDVLRQLANYLERNN